MTPDGLIFGVRCRREEKKRCCQKRGSEARFHGPAEVWHPAGTPYISIFFFESIGEIRAIDRHRRKSGKIFESHPGDSQVRDA
jgi:hypothetical protein